MAFRDKCLFLLSFFVWTLVVSCARTENDKFERVASFERNLVNAKEPELVCQLSESSILLREIVDFTILSDTSFVVLDGRGAYLYHISGAFKKQFGSSGQAGGEMISPSNVYATSNFVYIWCSSLMKFLIYDHEANFKKELSGFKRAVNKFVVNSSDEMLYAYTSGFFDETNNKMFDVINAYNITKESSKLFGERGPEDEVLSTWINSGGFYVDMDRFIYLHSGNLIVHNLDLNSDVTTRYKIDDKAFYTTEITSSIREIKENGSKLIDYLHKNSLVKGFYKNNDQYIIVSEIGQYDLNAQTRVMNSKERKVKLYILDTSFNPIHTILYDYVKSPNFVVHSNSLYFTTLMTSDEDQKISLNRFPLFEK